MILAIASQKGGVGKTTTAVNLAFSLSLAAKRALLLDLDPQGNGSSGVGARRTPGGNDAEKEDAGWLSVAVADRSLSPRVKPTQFEGLALLPSCSELARLDLIQEIQDRSLPKVRKQVRKVAADFDYVLVDCPPSLGGLPRVALAISEAVIVPVQCEYYAMEGLSQILPIIESIKNSTNKSLHIEGLLLTMFSDELELSHEVVQELTEYFPDSVFQTIIPRDVVLAEASSHGLPAFAYSPLSRGAWSYIELAREIMNHGRT